ncbi:MAG TPA: hypothetical protein VM487_24005 [Phycisphaerae bacterium]|nr:hypothetical protein [Phycisphaerae bacterium]
MEQLLALPENWNSYGARPVSHDAAARANEFAAYLSYVVGVVEPAVGATPDGDVGFCWDAGTWSLDVSIDGTGLISYVYLDEENHGNDRDTCTRDIAQLIPLLTQWSS